MKIRVERDRRSYDFRADQSQPDGFGNNWKNNSIDRFKLLDDNGTELFSCRCQSVANYCFGEMATADTVAYGDTIAPGPFRVCLFVEPRSFHGEIHGIIHTKDLDGQTIAHNSMQTTANGYQTGRWLIHDRYSFKTGADTNQAWSAGCIILSSFDLAGLNTVLKARKCRPGDIIPGEIVEV